MKTWFRPENDKPGNEKLNSRFRPEKKLFKNLEKAISWSTLISPISFEVVKKVDSFKERPCGVNT